MLIVKKRRIIRGEDDMYIQWERFGNDWINKRFVSGQDNIFIVENTENGACLYWFDDGPEIPTESVNLDNKEVAEMEKRIAELNNQGIHAVCDYLAGFFPDLQKYWMDNYGGV
jgi:hypothetical protein